MPDNHRNQRGTYRTSNQEWNENNGRHERDWEDRYSNYGSQENRGYGYSGSGSRYERQRDMGNWNQESNDQNRREYGGGRYDSDYNSGYGNQDRNYGYGGREYGSSYGGGMYQGENTYYGNAPYGSSGNAYGNTRNLYDRDYEGFNRSSGRNYGSSGIGGSNYGGYGDNWRRREGYRNPNESNYGRRYGEGNPNERSWWDRTRDEVTSWFGDEDAERRRERDRQSDYRGKGPRNYKRSDERIKEDINDRLSDDPFVDASDIDVTVNNGEVTLTGTVDDRGDKRRAEDIAEAVSGVKNVENRLRVAQTASSGNTGTGRSASSTGTPSAYESGATGTGATTTGKSSKGNMVTS